VSQSHWNYPAFSENVPRSFSSFSGLRTAGVSNSTCSVGHMSIYKVTSGPHYDPDATVVVPEKSDVSPQRRSAANDSPKQIFLLSVSVLRSRSRSRRFLGAVRVGFLATLKFGIGFFWPIPEIQSDLFLHHTPKLGIPVEMVQFLLKLLLKQRFLLCTTISIDFNSQISFPLC